MMMSLNTLSAKYSQHFLMDIKRGSFQAYLKTSSLSGVDCAPEGNPCLLNRKTRALT